MRYPIVGHFCETGFFGWSEPKFTDTETVRYLTYPAGQESPFVVFEDGLLCCYFPYSSIVFGYNEARYFEHPHYKDDEKVWARAFFHPTLNTLVFHVINFTEGVAKIPSTSWNNEKQELIQLVRPLLTAAMAILPVHLKNKMAFNFSDGLPNENTRLSKEECDKIDLLLLGIRNFLDRLSNEDRNKVFRALFDVKKITALPEPLQTKTYKILYYLWEYETREGIQQYLRWRLTQGQDATLCTLVQQQIPTFTKSRKDEIKDVSGQTLHFLFRDYCAERRAIDFIDGRVFSQTLLNSYSGLSLFELQYVLNVVKARQVPVSTDLNEVDMDIQRPEVSHQIDLIPIARIYADSLTEQEKKIRNFYNEVSKHLQVRVENIHHIISTEKFDDKNILGKKFIDDRGVIRSLDLQKLISLTHILCLKKSFYTIEKFISCVLTNPGIDFHYFFLSLSDPVKGKIVYFFFFESSKNELELSHFCSHFTSADDASILLKCILSDENKRESTISHHFDVSKAIILLLKNFLVDRTSQQQTELIEKLGGWNHLVRGMKNFASDILIELFFQFNEDIRKKAFEAFYTHYTKIGQRPEGNYTSILAIYKALLEFSPEQESQFFDFLNSLKPRLDLSQYQKHEIIYILNRADFRNKFSECSSADNRIYRLQLTSGYKGEYINTNKSEEKLIEVRDNLYHTVLDQVYAQRSIYTYYTYDYLSNAQDTVMLLLYTIDVNEDAILALHRPVKPTFTPTQTCKA